MRAVNTVLLYLSLPLHGTPVNNPIKLTCTSPETSVLALHFFAAANAYSSANLKAVLCDVRNQVNTLDAQPETDFNAKWPFKVIQGHIFRCQ